MERELTVKVNYVLGNQSAFTDAATAAETVKNKVGETVQNTSTWLGRLSTSLGLGGLHSSIAGGVASVTSGGGIMGMLKGAGVLAATGGVHSLMQDVTSLASGGMLQRGRGFIGMADTAYGWLTNRSQRERDQDLKLSEGSFQVGIIGQRKALEQQVSAMNQSVMYRPITEVDPLRRIAEERHQTMGLIAQTELDRRKAESKYQEDVKKMTEGNILGMKAGGKVDWMNVEKLKAEYMKDQVAWAERLNNLADQRLSIEKQNFEMKKNADRETRLQLGSMTFTEQQAVSAAADAHQAGEKLTPRQIGMLSSLPAFRKAMTEYKLKEAEAGGASDIIAKSGDPDLAPAAQRLLSKRKAGIPTTMDLEMESGEMFEAADNFKKSVMKGVVGVLKAAKLTDIDNQQMQRDFENQRNTIGERR